MVLTLAEGLVDQVKTYLTGNIASKLLTLDIRYTDSIVLAPPDATYVGIKSLKSIPNQTAMFIVSPEQRFHARSVTGGASKPTIIVGIKAEDMDSEILQRRLYRYGLALVELMIEIPIAVPGWAISTDEEWIIDHLATQSESVQSDYVGEVTLEVRAYAWEE